MLEREQSNEEKNQPSSQEPIGDIEFEGEIWPPDESDAEEDLQREVEKEQEAQEPDREQCGAVTEKVNLNQASLEELKKTGSVGPELAERIVEYRQEHGSFKTIEEVDRVFPISETRLQKIKEHATV